MKVYIVKGIVEQESNKPYSVISEYGVKDNMESAKKELKNVLNEIKQDAKNNENKIIDKEIYDTSFIIELDNGDYYEFEIVEIEITK